ncbi:secreted protein containing DUF1566 [Candidatus Magnetomorum sp. HK-1]|nr:secreted protein containing DUF1566 [Candidatus Magnetomorum sp. HK-1]
MNLPKTITMALCIFFLITGYCFSWPIPHSGQTKCYDDKREVPCPQENDPYYGQDAQFVVHKRSYTKLDHNGHALPESASHWVMVKDNVTGLIWEVKTTDNSIHDKEKKFTWEDAENSFIRQLNQMRFGGFSDWRLPTIKELASITNKGKYDPAIDQAFFPNTMSAFYWSSTSYAYNTGYAWGVHFYHGFVNYNAKSSSYYVRAVREGQ